MIDRGLVVDVPSRLRCVAGGSPCPPKLDGASGFVEFADDEVVVRIVTRAYRHSAARLLREITGGAAIVSELRLDEWTAVSPHVVATAECRVAEPDGGVVIALVVEAPHGDSRHRIGVELVAEGPDSAVLARLPLLRRMAASVRVAQAA